MKNKWVKCLALGLSVWMGAAALMTGCGNASGSDGSENAAQPAQQTEENTAQTAEDQSAEDEEPAATGVAAIDYSQKSADFTMIPGGAPELGWPVDIWEDTPAIKRWLAETPSGRSMTVAFETPPVSADSDYYSTLLATGQYTDFMCATLLPEEPSQLYSEGIIIDLTEYVDAFMPNYKAWMEAHPEYRPQMVATVDGEEKILEIFAVADQSSTPWEGYLYRRDWILKYGKNPETGAAFSGGWQDDEKTVWEDDIVFPSGNEDPIYISDWEWMFEIFQEAIKGEGLEGTGYAFQQMYTGYMSMGNLVTSFGGIAPGVYETRDGEIRNGWTDDEAAMRAYVECMKSWYDKGYMDQTFDEKSGDSIFFMIDQANTYSGNVGMWLGLTSMCGNAMNIGTPVTEDICYFACANPINDVYGDDSAKNKDPWVFFEAGSLLGGSVVVSDKAQDKDLETLFKQIDWLYSPEGAVFSSFGLTKEEAAEVGVSDVMEGLGLPNGSYTVTENEDGETVYVLDENLTQENGTAVSMSRFQIGLTINKNVDKHEGEFMMDQYEKIMRYEGGGKIDYLKNLLTPEQSDEIKMIDTNSGTYISTAIPDFITGRTELNDANWEDFVETLRGYGLDDETEMYRSVQ